MGELTSSSELRTSKVKYPKAVKVVGLVGTVYWYMSFPAREDLVMSLSDLWGFEIRTGWFFYYSVWLLCAWVLVLIAIDVYRKTDDGSSPRLSRDWLVRLWPVAILVVNIAAFIFVMSWSYWVNPETPSDRNDFIKTYFTILGGMFVGFQLWFAYLNKEANVANVRLAEDRHMSELFHNASGRLSGEEVEAVAGLYSLESIAESSDALYRPAMNMVATYIRSNSSAKVWGQTEAYQQNQDVVIAWGILSRRRGYVGGLEAQHPLYLHDPIVTDIQIHDGDFCAIKFVRAQFKSVLFMSCRMNGTRFVGCTFENVRFVDCDMRGAEFHECQGRAVSFEVTDKVPKLRTPRGVVKRLDEGTAAINVIVERGEEEATVGSDFLTNVVVESSPLIDKALHLGIRRANKLREKEPPPLWGAKAEERLDEPKERGRTLPSVLTKEPCKDPNVSRSLRRRRPWHST